MRTFVIPATPENEKGAERGVRDFVTEWVGLLADQKYSQALDALSPEIPPGSGSVDSRKSPRWTPQLLEAVIANYGTPNPVEGQPQTYAVVPLDTSLGEAFEANVSIDFNREAISNLNAPQDTKPRKGWLSRTLSVLGGSRGGVKSQKSWVGSAEFSLPVNFTKGNDLSDLSVRMLCKPITRTEMVLVLLDIHVL